MIKFNEYVPKVIASPLPSTLFDTKRAQGATNTTANVAFNVSSLHLRRLSASFAIPLGRFTLPFSTILIRESSGRITTSSRRKISYAHTLKQGCESVYCAFTSGCVLRHANKICSIVSALFPRDTSAALRQKLSLRFHEHSGGWFRSKEFATMLLSEFTRMHCSEAASQPSLRRRNRQGALLKPTPVEGRRCTLFGGALFGRVEEGWSSRDPFANTGVSGTRVVLRCWRAFIKSTDVLDDDRFVTIIYGWREGCAERASLFACLLTCVCIDEFLLARLLFAAFVK